MSTNLKLVSRLSDYTNNVMSISPEQAIQDFQQFLKDTPRFDKVFLLALDDKGGEFDVAWFKGIMLSSDALAALDIAKDDLRRALRGEGV
ncbi:MAG: hypothetical protein KAV87_49910 [Desulfobacteraceae bacterium]|nr:hypothetical protein [Desulfobacteraceae bacterium]